MVLVPRDGDDEVAVLRVWVEVDDADIDVEVWGLHVSTLGSGGPVRTSHDDV